MFSLQELQFQEQQEELQRELHQISTQQLLEQSFHDNSNSKCVDLDYYRRTYEKPQLITNVNNLNCHTGSNYNTINQSNTKDILHELKQYENFANNSNHHQLDQFNVNGYVSGRQADRCTGTNYSQNILNYNNSFYKINNINNYNYIKNQSTSSSSYFDRQNCYSKYQRDKYLLNQKMDRDGTAVECSQLVNTSSDVNGRNPTIQKFASHTTLSNNQHSIDDDEEQHNVNPTIHRSQHFTQVS